jgi:hypothetical protein
MGGSKAVGVVRPAVSTLNSGDVARYLAYFNPSCQRWAAGFTDPLTFADVGDGLRQIQVAFDGLRLDEDLLFGDETLACARWRIRRRHVRDYLGIAASGRSVDVATCEVYEIGETGLSAGTRSHGSLGDLIRQIIVDGDAP